MLDNLIAFRVLYMLVTPFVETKAYKLGIIDDKGTVLRKSKDLKTSEEKNAFTLLHRLVFNLKKLIAKLPGGETKLVNIAAAYFLIKENINNKNISYETLNESLQKLVEKEIVLIEETLTVLDFIHILEDAPVNATGPAVSTDEPVIKPRKKNKFAKVNTQRAILP